MPLARFGSLADKPSAKIQICSLCPNNEHPGAPPRRHLAPPKPSLAMTTVRRVYLACASL